MGVIVEPAATQAGTMHEPPYGAVLLETKDDELERATENEELVAIVALEDNHAMEEMIAIPDDEYGWEFASEDEDAKENTSEDDANSDEDRPCVSLEKPALELDSTEEAVPLDSTLLESDDEFPVVNWELSNVATWSAHEANARRLAKSKCFFILVRRYVKGAYVTGNVYCGNIYIDRTHIGTGVQAGNRA